MTMAGAGARLTGATTGLARRAVARTPAPAHAHAPAPAPHRNLCSTASPLASLRSSSVSPSSYSPSSTTFQSTLPNKVRVATQAAPGHFSAVGVYVDTGSRYERAWVPGESGVSHLLDRMAFKSTRNRSADEMTTMIEKMGGNVMCSSSRESIMYQSLVFNKDVEAALSILADTVLHPALLPEELAAQQEATRWEIGEIWNKPEMILPEVLHTVAFRDNTLGNPLLCPVESLEVMKVKHLRDFMDAWYTPERIVVAGAGMPHERMVELAAKWFGGLSAGGGGGAGEGGSAAIADAGTNTHADTPADTRTLPHAETRAHARDARARARYTGGELYESTPTMEFTQVYVAFEGLSIHDDDIYALATMQILLGGGGSFSAGGPGKGMYSRLYSNVLNQHHAVDFCAAFHHCYKDSGLFGIAASVKPDFNGHIANIIARELDSLTSPHVRGAVTSVELARAKNQLKSSLVMSLESRLVEVEDLGRQVQVHGHKVSVEEMCEKIDGVDLDALHRVANRVLRAARCRTSGGGGGEKNNFGLGSGQSTVVAQGNLDGLGDVRRTLANRGLGGA
ncbi:hypothetical protein IE81DRAFT_349775 [Ceraceosorus guamensis]|uniref:Mitochondrial-processing peptidase subunit alpha n=1 Tax=Ceraceosorus guamensis TaxID=1522189 RepID=A0A316VQS1_9BASI|nr:hypothetical protein IE81DRAFT_349775 [Ceraceosorus guamensis]PWN39872.1 hypothetical protein IE81DRAFT_349775 [Ceraceosorus guamensis]